MNVSQVWMADIPGTSIPIVVIWVATVFVVPGLVILWHALSPATGIEELKSKIRQLHTFFMVCCIWYFVVAFAHFFAVKYSSAKGLTWLVLFANLLWWFLPYLFMFPAICHINRRTNDLEDIQAVKDQIDRADID